MKRGLFTVFAAMSMMLCAAVAVLWFRSLRVIDWVQWTDHRHFPGVVSSDGRIIYSYQFWPNGVGGNEGGLTFGSRPGDPPYWGRGQGEESRNHLFGFEWSPVAGVRPTSAFIKPRATPTTYVVAVPHWFLCALTSMPALLWARGRRRQRLSGSGLCRICGYDLRATPDRCPECGSPANNFTAPVTIVRVSCPG